MSLVEIINVATAILLSLGGGGAIVLCLSGWLGKVWSERLMASERARHEAELAKLRADLEKENQESLKKLQADLDLSSEKIIKAHHDKLQAYQLVGTIIADFVADLDVIRHGRKPAGDALERFNRNRLRAHAFLAMLAPQTVMDRYDALVEYLFEVLEKPTSGLDHEYWEGMRSRSYQLLNAIRDDVGIDKIPIEYRGNR